MTKEQGTMDFDFRKRCVTNVRGVGGMPDHQIIFYGLTAVAVEVNNIQGFVFDMPSPYIDLSTGGRTRPIEDEYKHRKHFFNKRIRTREESIGGETVQTGSDADRIRARYGVGSASSVAETAPAEGGAGCGDPNCKDSDCDYGKEEVSK